MTTSLTITAPSQKNHKTAAPKKSRGGKDSGYKLSTRDRRARSKFRWASF